MKIRDTICLFWCLFLGSAFIFATASCSEKDKAEPVLPETIQISKFSITSVSPVVEGVIDQQKKTINCFLDATVNIKSLKVEVEYTQGASLSPESGYNYNFTNPVEFVLTKDDQRVVYTVSAQVTPIISSFEVEQYHKSATVKDDVIEIAFNFGTDLTRITPQIRVPAGLTLKPASNTEVDLSKDFVYEVTNALGTKKLYTVKASHLPQEKSVRGVWVPDPSHTTVMHNYKNLNDFIALLDQLNMNTIYLASWVREMTIFKSQVLKANSNYGSVEDGWLLKGIAYDGPSGDPIRDMINLAHAKGIKVIFWFEYGFMRSGGATPPANHPILSKHPTWDGVNSEGKPSNYNGTDYYLNSYDPEVQEFMLQLIEESIDLYPDVDGIQGDDRMPAAPRNSGYNDVTKQAYKIDKGVEVPSNYQDGAWVRWRLDNLNQFGRDLYKRVKAKRDNLIVCFSPNPYPWCEENLMQDWPQWIKDGIVEIISVQCYRETADSYRYTVNQTNQYVKQSTNKNILNPGIYLRSGSSWENVFVQQMLINRELGTNGETFFYNEGLKLSVNQKVLKSFYTGKAIFPIE